MGCAQSASKPVARPDANGSSIPVAIGSASASNANGSAGSSDAVRVEDVKPNLTMPAGSVLSTTADSTAAASAASSNSATLPATRPAAAGKLSITHPALVKSVSGSAVTHMTKLRPLVVCGPSGVGKGTLLSRLIKEHPHIFAKSVSHTTRAPRAGEEAGISYHFTHADKLLQEVKEGKFIEHANVHGNYYGTSISSVAHVMDSGKICLLEIDIQGVTAVRETALHPISIFVRAPTFQDLVDRLTGRGSESAHTMAKRLDTARNEMDFFYTNRHFFEGDLINDDFEQSYARLIALIQQLYPEVNIQPQKSNL